MAWLTAVRIGLDELSTCSSAGDTHSRKRTARSAARIGYRMDLENVLDVEEQRLVRTHFASFRSVSS
jgi:hypothetical protein